MLPGVRVEALIDTDAGDVTGVLQTANRLLALRDGDEDSPLECLAKERRALGWFHAVILASPGVPSPTRPTFCYTTRRWLPTCEVSRYPSPKNPRSIGCISMACSLAICS